MNPLNPLFLALVLAVMDTPAATPAVADEASFLNERDMQWKNAPPSLPKGARLSILYGDPAKAGAYSLRARLPAGYVLPPHFHTHAENLTVLSGALYLGMGDSLDKKAVQALTTGGFHHVPGKAHQFAYTKTATVLQISGEGPFDITYLNHPAGNSQVGK